MMTWLATAVMGSWYARCAAAVLAGFIALKVYGYTKKEQGKEELRVESKQAGKVAHAKSEKAHGEASRPGAAERLMRNSCRDCGK